MIVLKTKDLKKVYQQGSEVEVHALQGVDIEIEQGEFVAIVGTSGSGKTTLLNMIGGLDYSSKGSVTILDTDIETLKDKELTIFRRRNIGFVFQNYNLISTLNVYENIVLPLQLDGKQIDVEFVDNIIDTLKLKEKIHTVPLNLSGGQQQRVAIARALVNKPAIILADEPTGNLDSKTSMEVIELLKMSAAKYQQTIIVVTHSEEIAQLCDRIIRIEDGLVG
ncbi:putative ABC transport system ATP-binding protein [Breznakia sp. PF5-3]|uniref:ABC transporter ATP-binding protein n=1 Tax=unclassified Breznakia TaxID=2623764 RepID=UPI002406BD15|nr:MULTISPECIES: ABC transporter ATP-binding protein [unclassified Breznakia]MDF9825701.1 putative ABC transport system ATP-binding protein [Breznakia sp. PM6-1]MDF9836537.1 putative ABC transport system ATP-binding protein [Breznakia sp. PF5-3]MDF9838771.1 putative ABC transport system ATP-binding protein [Breznakia sp. PFB2-8]MDF9860797.1 putative ABC transport system ATP-binding protein [Breznakia sp. PH5-24]